MRTTVPCLIIAAVIVRAAQPVSAAPMTVEQAYAAIPHERTVFNPAMASMAPDEAAYLKELFAIIDLAVKERVETLLWLQSGGTRGDEVDEYDMILGRLKSLPVPGKLLQVHQLVTDAIQEQCNVLREWRKAPKQLSMQHPLVHSSSRKLYQAYGGVIQLYSKEDTRNLQAFYDYFCCLDFL